MTIIDSIGIGVLTHLPLVRLQFIQNAFGVSPQSVVADVGMTYESVDTLIKSLTDVMAQIRQAQANAAAVSDGNPNRSVN